METNEIKNRILSIATALHNACMKTRKENRCKECPFYFWAGCDLYGHPIEWEEKLSKIEK